MLKLMKYEFRKMRTPLLVLLLILVGLEGGFLAGHFLNHGSQRLRDLMGICFGLINILTFAVYGYILVAGIASYSRELKDRTGYLVFMAPVRPIAIVLSKLLFTILTAVLLAALFGAVTWLDYRLLLGPLKIDETIVGQFNLFGRVALNNAAFDVKQIALELGYLGATVLIGILLMMCTVYLAITLSATLLQNRKGFLRALVSVALFFALSYGSGKLSELVNRAVVPNGVIGTTGQLLQAAGAMLGLSLVLSLVFAILSASLLKRKVSL